MTDAAGPHGPARTSALIVVPILTANGRSIDVQRRREEAAGLAEAIDLHVRCLLYTSPSPRDGLLSRMPSSA